MVFTKLLNILKSKDLEQWSFQITRKETMHTKHLSLLFQNGHVYSVNRHSFMVAHRNINEMKKCLEDWLKFSGYSLQHGTMQKVFDLSSCKKRISINISIQGQIRGNPLLWISVYSYRGGIIV